ncbi:hypothetical protein FIM02_03015 [SAR202 cluster bacterium AD-802-E10_MRT_200m]|nr:hypothetical protein [SAR202 cluster bacterium AD-802-E10_MRT_200m]
MMIQDKKPFTSFSFYEYIQEGKFMGVRCNGCSKIVSMPRPLCPVCHSEDLVWMPFSGEGNIETFTTIVIAPTFMINKGYGRDMPYCSAVVQLKEGPRVSARIVGVDASKPESIKLGTPVVIDFPEIDPDQQGLVFRTKSKS